MRKVYLGQPPKFSNEIKILFTISSDSAPNGRVETEEAVESFKKKAAEYHFNIIVIGKFEKFIEENYKKDPSSRYLISGFFFQWTHVKGNKYHLKVEPRYKIVNVDEAKFKEVSYKSKIKKMLNFMEKNRRPVYFEIINYNDDIVESQILMCVDDPNSNLLVL